MFTLTLCFGVLFILFTINEKEVIFTNQLFNDDVTIMDEHTSKKRNLSSELIAKDNLREPQFSIAFKAKS